MTDKNDSSFWCQIHHFHIYLRNLEDHMGTRKVTCEHVKEMHSGENCQLFPGFVKVSGE